jgi:transposase
MRFYTKQHPFYCGIDLHARTMSRCVLNQDGAILLHRNMPAGPAPCLTAVAPYRTALVVCVACLFPWDWLADLGAREGMPFVLGHALSMQAMHGGKAKNDKIEAQNIAVLLRGGMLPQASGSPAEMRATRDRLRRRRPLMRQRAALWTQVPQTNRQDHVPEIGKKSAYQANRSGVAERLADPAVPKSVAVALALLDYDDQRLRDLELASVQTAQQHEATTLYVLQTVPGLGKIRSLVLLSAMHDIARFPRGQDFVASCRVVQGAKESAGTRSGPSGTQSGNASLTWAFSAAAVLFLRNHPAGQKSLARFEKKHGKGQALTVVAHPLARAVSSMVPRRVVFTLDPLLQRSGRGAGAPAASLGHAGRSLVTGLCMRPRVRRRTPMSPSALCPDPARLLGRLLSLLSLWRKSLRGTVCCPSPAPAPHWRTQRGSPMFEEDGRRVQRSF